MTSDPTPANNREESCDIADTRFAFTVSNPAD